MDKNLKRSLTHLAILITICLWWACSGCVTAHRDCKHFAYDYCKALPSEAKGHVVIGRVGQSEELHARVVYYKSGIEKMADPTWGIPGKPVEEYTDWKLIKICETPEDVFDPVLTINGKLIELEK